MKAVRIAENAFGDLKNHNQLTGQSRQLIQEDFERIKAFPVRFALALACHSLIDYTAGFAHCVGWRHVVKIISQL